MFAFFCAYSFMFVAGSIVLGLPGALDAYLARREMHLEVETGRRLVVKRAIIRTLRGAL